MFGHINLLVFVGLISYFMHIFKYMHNFKYEYTKIECQILTLWRFFFQRSKNNSKKLLFLKFQDIRLQGDIIREILLGGAEQAKGFVVALLRMGVVSHVLETENRL